jgi:hypothetical protein
MLAAISELTGPDAASFLTVLAEQPGDRRRASY